MRFLAGVCALVIALAPTRAAANCGAEGCPIGPANPEASRNRFAFNVGYLTVEQNRYWDGNHSITAADALADEGGTGHVLEQLTRTKTWNFDASAQLRDDLRLSVSLPYVDRIHRHALAHHVGFFVESEWHMTGLGDASTVASWTTPFVPRTSASSLVLQVGAKFPTGKREVEEIDGEQPEPSARPGSGSTDGLVGLQYQYRMGARSLGGAHVVMPITASVSARLNGIGTEDYRMGNELLAHVGTVYPLTSSVRLLARIDASTHKRDDVGTTDAEPHHTGSSTVLASPGLQASLAQGLSLFGLYQFRLYQHTNGPQLVSPYHLVVGFGYALR